MNNNTINKIDSTILEQPWRNTPEDVLQALQVNPDKGLTSEEIEARRDKFGSNQMEQKEKKSALEIFFNQLKSIIVALLAIAAIVSFIFEEILQGIAISAVIIINTLIGFVTELKASRSMEALYELTKIKTKVKRENEVKEIVADNIVVGDIIRLGAGDLVPGDLRIIESSRVKANESSLTGESIPVEKTKDKINEETPLAERTNMLYKGTALTRGSAEAVVIATGEDTELGKISTLVQEAGEGETPLTKRLQKLGRNLFWVTLIIAVAVAISGIIQDKELLLMIESALALAVATVPEGLPVVATISLARGMWRMANKDALINRLSAVETLGSTNIICTDKTGTLTENRMTVVKLFLDNQIIKITGRGMDTEGKFQKEGENIDPNEIKPLLCLIKTSLLCNNATLRTENGPSNKDKESVGDPLEIALLIMGAKMDLSRTKLLNKYPEIQKESFDPTIKMMASINQYDKKYLVSVKGATKNVLDACNSIWTKEGIIELNKNTKNNIMEKNRQFANDGLRVISAATKEVDTQDTNPYSDLVFLGLIGLLDPPREEVKPAIEKCKTAGIKVIMITGDQAETARYIGRELGLIQNDDSRVKKGKELTSYDNLSDNELEEIKTTTIFARVEPEQKLNLIEIYQKEGSVVAMTGDGVNDAPALRKANIGVAMGQRGTQVAQEAADMVLKDDNFNTITKAVEEGRIITDNIKKFVIYLLSCNISEILLVFFASLFGMPLPLLPLQILFLNVVTDIFPAFALTAGEGASDLMKNPPRDPEKPIITKKNWGYIVIYGFILTLTVFGTFSIALYILEMDENRAVTISFLTLAFVQIWHVLNMRNKETSLINNEVLRNKYVWGAILLSIILVLLATYVPGLNTVLETVDPQFEGWVLILGMSIFPLIVVQTWKLLAKYL
ncbi:MAG: ATPase [Promethearchaeota archaeon]|nr:MAG: ATPase [Candidatus Lokiarchaeota archaeon]